MANAILPIAADFRRRFLKDRRTSARVGCLSVAQRLQRINGELGDFRHSTAGTKACAKDGAALDLVQR